jgi:murein DD-endopeptidase MepM/ murein hydrolase activator NlpD
MGRVARERALAVAIAAAIVVLAVGCSHGPKRGQGAWHRVERGDTLWRLAQRYDTSVAAIERANDGVDSRALRVGRKLWIPRGGIALARRGEVPAAAASTLGRRTREAGDACGDLTRGEEVAFEWPVPGDLTSRYGDDRGRRLHDGVDLVADAGTPIRAAETGVVLYAGEELGDYGKVVILGHLGPWATVYAHNRENFVDEGEVVGRGDVIAEVGETGNASAPHLHFEVRHRDAPYDPETCLP